MDERSAISTQGALCPVQTHHGLALAFRDRLWKLSAVYSFLGWIDCLGSALGSFEVGLKCPTALVLRLIDLPMSMKPSKRITAKLAKAGDLFSGLIGIIDCDRRILPRGKRVPRSPVMDFLAQGCCPAVHVISPGDN